MKNLKCFIAISVLAILFGCNSPVQKSCVKPIEMENPIVFDFSSLSIPQPSYIKGMDGISPSGDEIKVNSQYLEMNGTPWLTSYGEFQFSRYPQEYWEDAILKLKSMGFYGISVYVFWIHHEEIEDQWNWKGKYNFRKFIKLCKKHNMGVFARIGPWVHGECAYGGHPEWLVKRLSVKNKQGQYSSTGGKLRSTDPQYLKAVEDLYSEIGKQMKGLYWKDGGPVFAIQLDNENWHHGPGRGAELMKEEKRLALKYGMVVPLYTCTGWAKAEFVQGETVPAYGSYADYFWVKPDTVYRNDSYSFIPYRANSDIGSDVKESEEGKEYNYQEVYDNNPYLTCETGIGMNMAYHRRTKVNYKDNGALSLIELGSGCNGMGYFIAHGGNNPVGKTRYMNESIETGANDNSVISNDFQAAIGEFGQVRKSFHEYPVQLHFMADFGKYLAPCKAFFPSNIDPSQGGDAFDPKRFQTAVRTDGNTGFIFVSTYAMHDSMFQFNHVQYQLKLKNETLNIPEKAISIPRGKYFVWPYNLTLDNINIKYATVQPVAHLKKSNTYVFFQNDGIDAEFILDNTNVKSVIGKGISVEKRSGSTKVNIDRAGLNCYFDVALKKGTSIRILVLNEQLAKQIYKHNDQLYISDAEVLLFNQDKLEVISEKTNNTVWVYPGNIINGIKIARDGLFQKFSVAFNKIDVAFNYTQVQDGKDIRIPNRFDSRGIKVGVPDEKYFDMGTIVDMKFPNGIPKDIYDVRVKVDYVGSCLRLYKDHNFIYDNYYNETAWVFSASHLLQDYSQATDLQLKILPLQPNDPIYIAGKYWPDLKRKGNALKINQIKAVPVYKRSFILTEYQ